MYASRVQSIGKGKMQGTREGKMQGTREGKVWLHVGGDLIELVEMEEGEQLKRGEVCSKI